MKPPITVIEAPEFLDATKKLMAEEEREALLFFLAATPDAGDVIPGTGGVRKLRWALEGRGKRGGARVITSSITPRCRSFCSRPTPRTRKITSVKVNAHSSAN